MENNSIPGQGGSDYNESLSQINAPENTSFIDMLRRWKETALSTGNNVAPKQGDIMPGQGGGDYNDSVNRIKSEQMNQGLGELMPDPVRTQENLDLIDNTQLPPVQPQMTIDPVPTVEETEAMTPEDPKGQETAIKRILQNLKPQAKQQSDLAKKYEEALKKRDETKQMAMLVQAGQTIADAIAGQPLSKSESAEFMASKAGEPMKDLINKMALDSKDPGSNLSKMHRTLALKAMPNLAQSESFENLSSDDLKALGITLPKRSALTPYQEEMIKIQKGYQSIQKQKLSQRKAQFGESEERRQNNQEVAFNKNLYNVTKDFEKDDLVKDLKKQGIAFDQASDLISAMEGNNQMALGPLGTKMARAMGEVGVLTDADVVRYIQAQGVSRKAQDFLKRNLSGKISNPSTKDLKDIVNMMKIGFTSKREKALDKYVKRAHRNFGKQMDMSEQQVRDRFAEEVGATPKSNPQDKAAMEWVQKNPEDPRAEVIKAKLKAKGLM